MAAAAALATMSAGTAHADIRLTQPPSWIVEGQNGDPQSVGPCGANDNVCHTPTTAVTTFLAGQTITVSWIETVAFDGWYRIALSYDPDRADLTDPAIVVAPGGHGLFAVDAGDGGQAYAGVEDPTAPPVLVDGVFPHAAADTPVPNYYSYYLLQLPDRPCDKCTLQVIQVLAKRPGEPASTNPHDYVYHHCADIAIVPAADASMADPAGVTSMAPDASADALAPCGSGDGGIEDEASTSEPAGDAAGAVDATAGPFEDGETAADANALPFDGTTDAGGEAPGSKGGCGCTTAGAGGPASLGLGSFVGVAALARRRRSRRQRTSRG
jgi:MYXO-CTERM domain-containing protein